MNSTRGTLQQKTFNFSAKIIAICRQLSKEQKEYDLSRQLIRSGTAIGALVSEAGYAESMADFIHKMSIALKECAETQYWLKVMSASGMINKDHEYELTGICNEISYMLIATLKSCKKKIKYKKIN